MMGVSFGCGAGPARPAQALIAEASKPGADFAKLVAENSIAPSALDGGDLGWIARYQLEKGPEDAIFATQAKGISEAVECTGIVFYVVSEIVTRLPDPDQAKMLREGAFANWYLGIKNDPDQTTIERLLDGPLSTPTPKVDPSVGLKIGGPYTLAPFDAAQAGTFARCRRASSRAARTSQWIGGAAPSIAAPRRNVDMASGTSEPGTTCERRSRPPAPTAAAGSSGPTAPG